MYLLSLVKNQILPFISHFIYYICVQYIDYNYLSLTFGVGTRCNNNNNRRISNRGLVSMGYSNSDSSSRNRSKGSRGVAGSSLPTNQNRISRLPAGSRPGPIHGCHPYRHPRFNRDRWRCPTAISGNYCNSSTWPDRNSATLTCRRNGISRRTSTKERK